MFFSQYNTLTDASTATNTGQGNIQVTASRGYNRISLIQDGSFQDYTCILQPGGSCPFIPSAFWTRVIPGQNDFILVNNYQGITHSGTSAALFFFTTNSPPPFLGSTLTYALPLNAVPGKTYVISLFHTPSSDQSTSGAPMVSALWNGVPAINITQPGPVDISTVLTYFNIQAEVVATGHDTFVLQDGTAFTHTVYIDDIAIFEKWY
ncbi:hypothetical protein BDN70DRAFT_877402 [Pholiota conissans]|uniref:Uncharacterized protein n=1 Tax=Pholiota conissans TaxID=109636 RepID=A0A9P5Z3Q8_9AGAR|nr:hypothetical protein BDN70DRAFT_877402 [Pholiota conissans]